MSDFKTSCDSFSNLDPYKRVNYVNGLVLGADDFVQEQLYHLEKHRLHNRSLHGYGTVCGLAVTVDDTADGPRVTVQPGIAVDPQGHEIRLSEPHCANLDTWLDHHRDEVQNELAGSPPVSPLVSPPELLSLYLTLCYRECKTDDVPIPGGPCKTLDDSSVASRIQDAYELRLQFNPPDQTEHHAVIALIECLGGIEISAVPGGMTSSDIQELVLGLLDTHPAPASPPLHIHPDDLRTLINDAMRVWVTEVRPNLLPSARNCSGGPPDEVCVLLAEVQVPLDDALNIIGAVQIEESVRPYLLHTRLLQEYLLSHWVDAATAVQEAPQTFATLSLLDPSTIRVWIHFPDLLDVTLAATSIAIEPPVSLGPQLNSVTLVDADLNLFDLALDGPLSEGDHVTVSFEAALIGLRDSSPTLALSEVLQDLDHRYLDAAQNQVRAYLTLSLGNAALSHSGLGDLGSDDHTQYLLVNGDRAMEGDFDAGGHLVVGLAEAADLGQAVRFEQAVKVDDPLDTNLSDLSGQYPNPTVARIQTHAVAPTQPQNGQVLAWSDANNRWQPGTPSAADLGDFVRVSSLGIPYAIVAAGFFDPLGAVGSLGGRPVNSWTALNNLRVVSQTPGTPGEFRMTFDNYVDPGNVRLQYLVKGTIIQPRGASPVLAIITCVDFDANGFLVRILSADPGVQARVGFMVEVSAYGEPASLSTILGTRI